MSLDRTTAPPFIIPEEISFIKPTKRTLPNGVHLYFNSTPNLGAVRIEVNGESLRGELGVTKKMVSFFTLHMLLEGTVTKSGAELDDFFDYYASEVEIISSFEHQGIALLTTKKHFSSVLPVFRELMTEAVFPEKELQKLKSQKALNISIQFEKNAVRASHLFRQQLFGESHPYGMISEERDVALINREDLVDYYQNYLWVNPEIFIAGDLTENELELIENVLGDLPVHSYQSTPPQFANIGKELLIENREKSVQSSVRLGCHLIPKTHPDYHALSVFNTFLGGYFGSRLIKNIREDKGHTYGIYSSIGGLKSSDYWVIAADVKKEYTSEVLDEIYKELEILQYQEIPIEELETVRNYLIGNLLSTFSSSFELINRFKGIHQAGLDLSFYENRLSFLKNFQAADIQRTGQQLISQDYFVGSIVG
ncbi:M16 family metallopeptidase [Mongoliitalea daihaiensis]|uniref:M16 family metallopeptidase n=1 Tax=Mongoliitalea daihaiensis TaxID=2782006 RepID=UPI001F391A2C|nr:pitrilysin family protein [Mongoliitalea daihaiensis]UJP63308.1 insulinase family protein [Mongoliitalea daihaiensis]